MKTTLRELYLASATLGLSLIMNNVFAEQPSLQEQASQITHKYLLTDTHIDVPYRVHNGWVDVAGSAPDGEFDYPRAIKGGLDLPFMSIYTPAEMEKEGGSFQLANELIDSVEAIAARAPGKFMLVRSVADANKARASGRIGLAMGMENGSPIDHKIENVRFFADRGIRYITLAHGLSNQICDSSYDDNHPWGGLSPFGKEVIAEMNRAGIMVDVSHVYRGIRYITLTHGLSNQICDSSYDDNHPWGGLSPFGKEVIAEMNRAGIMVDISHVSDDAFWQTLEITKVPVIASHSSARHFTPGFERNMSDDMIIALAKNGGVIQINWGSSFVTAKANAYSEELKDARDAWLKQNGFDEEGEEATQFVKDYRAKLPFPYATVAEVIDHFDHVIKLVGVDHVGIGSDFDGVGDSLPIGLKDVSEYPNLVAGFLQRGYSEDDIAGILGGNLLRVWAEVEAYAQESNG